MLHSNDLKIGADHTIVQIQIPCTQGIALRGLFQQAFGEEKCLDNYRNEIQQLHSAQLASYALIVWHFAYGIHRYLKKLPLYISVSVLAHPIDRYIATYIAFLNNRARLFHPIVVRMNINQFLRHGLESDHPGLSNQFNNLQCRLICYQSNFKAAREFIDTWFFLICIESGVPAMAAMLARALNLSESDLPQVPITQKNRRNTLRKANFRWIPSPCCWNVKRKTCCSTTM